MSDEISMVEAAARGIAMLRMRQWASPTAHIEIAIVDGRPGPWVKLWSDTNAICDAPNPREILITEFDVQERCFLPYEPPITASPAAPPA